MSAAVCGTKRSFDDEYMSPSRVYKRIRCGSSCPSPSLFSPSTDPQILERELEECGNDLESAVNSVQSDEYNSVLAAEEAKTNVVGQGSLAGGDGSAAAFDSAPAPTNLPVDGAAWVDLFVREMMSATSLDNAKARAARLLESLEKSIKVGAAEEVAAAAPSFQQENIMMKEKIEVLIRENSILKRAVAIQHERQKDIEDKILELQHLKQLVPQYQEQLRTLEVNNYALKMHLQQAEQSSSIPGRFHPDVF